jgi:RNA polymerase sigma-70 factor (ECF subfamily)
MARSMTSWASQPLLRPELLLARAKPAAAGITTREIFQGHAEFVLRLVRRLGVRTSDVDDVAQEVFVIVHRRLADLQAGVPVRSWLFGIARRVVANYRRQLHRRQELPSPQLEDVAVACDQVNQLQSSRDRARLEFVLGRLDSEKREVFVLFELEGMDMKDVADMIGCPLNTAYSRLYAARLVVRQALSRTRLRGER